ncbi:hypothetical protein KEM52_000534 [Ascosphaera acerosa]|nr:hypothetical protein KEM52_000534 [Ascosphaera acerosa]
MASPSPFSQFSFGLDRRLTPSPGAEDLPPPVPALAPAPAQLLGYHDKPLIQASGVTVTVSLAEPVLFLEGFDRGDGSTRKTTLLRGHLRLNVSKATKIKKLYLNFRGKSHTWWPEGLPPNKESSYDEVSLMNHTWTFFNAHFAQSEHSYCADSVKLTGPTPATESNRLVFEELFHTTRQEASPIASLSLTSNTAKEIKKRTLQPPVGRPRSTSRGEAPQTGSVASRGYKVFYPGDYIYNFELPIDSRMPETIALDQHYVKYELESIVERAGHFRANLFGSMEVPLIRTPSETSLEHVEPIAISRTWDDQLHYDIVISGKLFPLGARVPIAFKFTPLSKVNLHRIKVYLTENTVLYNSQRTHHKCDGSKKILLLDKRAGGKASSAYPGSTMRVNAGGGYSYDQRIQMGTMTAGKEPADADCTNLLGDLHPGIETGPTEYEFNVQLPTCPLNKMKPVNQRMHVDTTYDKIEINHWIKIVLRLSRTDPNDPSKWKHFEISIDSPFHLISCRASRSNTALPAYSKPMPQVKPRRTVQDCNCEGALRDQIAESNPTRLWNTTSSTAGITPESEHSPQAPCYFETDDTAMRPIHLIRAPSFGPPPFDAITPPPPEMLLSPPPDYGSIFHASEDPYEDYFARLQIARKENDYEERHRRSSRVDIPLNPGGRINRSMDVPREWVGVGDETSVQS